jgi:multisubunit Na+/H+ antiporter MnhG subunit
MRLFKLTFATIFRRKAWAICLFAVLVLPFALPMISSATEKPVLLQPARIQAAWGTLFVCTMLWGFFAAANLGESNTKSGAGEYFRTTGLSATRQLFEIWLALFAYIVPLAIIATCICLFAAMPGDPNEKAMWWTLNFQYLALFLLVFAPLLALAIALASRFGGITGFGVTLFITIYGLYGVS